MFQAFTTYVGSFQGLKSHFRKSKDLGQRITKRECRLPWCFHGSFFRFNFSPSCKTSPRPHSSTRELRNCEDQLVMISSASCDPTAVTSTDCCLCTPRQPELDRQACVKGVTCLLRPLETTVQKCWQQARNVQPLATKLQQRKLWSRTPAVLSKEE